MELAKKKRLLVGLFLSFFVLISIQTILTKNASREASIQENENREVKAAISCANPDAAVVISIDRSSSMNRAEPDGRKRLEWAKDAASVFVRTLMDSGINTTQVSINSFGGQGNDGSGSLPSEFNSLVHIGLTNNYSGVLNAIGGVRYIKTGSCSQCGIRLANKEILSSPKKRVAILFSDGATSDTWEGDSRGGKQAAIDEAEWGRDRGIEYWVIGYGEGTIRQYDPNTLIGIAGDPSRYFYRPNPSDWNSAILEILNNICGTATAEPTPEPITSKIVLPNITFNGPGAFRDIYPKIDPVNSVQGPMAFSIDSPIANFNPNPDNPGYLTRATALSFGSTYYYGTAVDTAGNPVQGKAKLTVASSTSWCQVRDGDLVVRGDAACIIPPSCTASLSCSPYLIAGSDGAPGVASVGKNIYVGSGQTSRDPFNYSVTNNFYSGRSYDYSFLVSKAESSSTYEVPGIIYSVNDLTAGNISGNYFWNRSKSNLIVNGNINVGTRKILLYVDGDLYIRGKINVDDGRGFFMAIVGGNIIVDASVHDGNVLGGRPDFLPEIEGIYFTNGVFVSETNGAELDQQLHIRGTVVARDFDLQRDLPDNSSVPSEVFEFAPDQILRFPALLSKRQISWREVAP